MSNRRKITFHSIITTHLKLTTKDLLLSLFDKIHETSKASVSKLDIDIANGDGLQFILSPNSRISENTVRVFAKARFIKYNDLPNTYRKGDGEERSLADDTEDEIGIPEETHFVIDISYDTPLIAIETCQGGPKANSIKLYLEHWFRKFDFETEVNIEPIIGRNIEEFIQVITECASLEIKVNKNNIQEIKDAENKLGTFLEIAQDYANTDYVKFIIGFDYNVEDGKKSSTNNLINRIKELVKTNKRFPNFFKNFETAVIRAKENDDQLKIYDLIMDRTAAEVFVAKRSPKSKYFDSEKMYNEIGKEITRNFRKTS